MEKIPCLKLGTDDTRHPRLNYSPRRNFNSVVDKKHSSDSKTSKIRTMFLKKQNSALGGRIYLSLKAKMILLFSKCILLFKHYSNCLSVIYLFETIKVDEPQNALLNVYVSNPLFNYLHLKEKI